ncbi:MAG: co-chaperone GroES [Eggerthellales bacterium]|nr:co-chaperone GroES [Eggerthellales bacterium]
MALAPLSDRILIRQDEAEETTAGGLYIASDSQEKPQSGVVVAVGPGKYDKNGNIIPMPVEVGDHVVFAKYGATEVEVDGETLMLMRAEDMYAKYTD